MEHLKYGKQQIYMEGIIVDVSDGAVSLDLKGRLGFMKVPKRMLISKDELKIGQEVGFMMSYPEVLRDAVDEKYLSIINRNKKVKEAVSHGSFNS